MNKMAFPDFLYVSSTCAKPDEEFSRIAGVLFNDYSLLANNKEYDFFEVEFYFDSPDHKDNFIYTKTNRNQRTGEWFFHLSGIDLTFGDETKGIRGGILIRAVKCYEPDDSATKYIIGPWRVMLELLNNIHPILNNGELKLTLVPKAVRSSYIPEPMIRKGLPKKEGYNNMYRFVASLKELSDKIPKGMFTQYYS
jgi:hypothetical protein